ncbi:GDSL-type esterase/lipase family protein [Sodaliphilus sp.]|uniref:GDSL-type esterase/lipase family protein n=1 Tax=Sodaliphilus sp. TaxID=2815818 RepID=UPI00388EBD0F
MKHILAIAAISLMALTATAQHSKDWAQLHKYAGPNIELNNHKNNGKRVVLLGNSITEYWVGKHPDFFKNTGYIGRGISGQTSYQFLVRFREDVVDLKPKVVVINVGTNDIAENTGPYFEDRTMGNIMSMVEIAKANKINVILTSVLPCKKMYWSGATGVADKIASLNKRIAEYAKKNKIPYVDYYSAMVEGDERALNHNYTEDGVHPNPAGYDVMEPLLQTAVRKYVK